MTDALARQVRGALLEHPQGIYLNSAAEGLPLAAARDGYERYLGAKSRGSLGRAAFDEIENEARVEFAALLGVPASDVAFLASTSRGIDAVIKSIDWSPGDSIVLPAGEFPTARFAAELLGRTGVTVRLVDPAPDGSTDENDLVTAIDATTRLVIVSVVSFKTGQHHHSAEIVARAHDVGAMVLLDCVQAAGQVEFDVGEADFACAASFKWLQGVHGAAGLYASPRAVAALRPPYSGYRSVTDLFPPGGAAPRLHVDARRYQEGLPDFGALAVLVAVLRAAAPWRAQVPDHNGGLVARLRDGLLDLGARVLAPQARRGSIVSFETARGAEIATELAREGTTVWARDGRVRLSPHAYTTVDDVESVLGQLARIGVA
jgi:selenocysteine lyase/cysteine desulfurase